jgi:hypothetical protein
MSTSEVNGDGKAAKDPCHWRPGVNAEWLRANQDSLAVPLKVDCDGTYTTKWPDDLESISYRALVKEGTANPNQKQVKDMEHQIIALNDHDEGNHHGYRTLDCNPDFIGKNWHLLVPGVTPDCQAPAPPTPPRQETIVPPTEQPPCHSCEWDNSLEAGPAPDNQNPREGDRHPQQGHQEFHGGDGEVIIYNEKGGVINFNDDDCDCGPSNFVPQGRQQFSQPGRGRYVQPQTFDEQCPEGGCGPDPRWLPRQNPNGPDAYYTGRGQVASSNYNPGDFE